MREYNDKTVDVNLIENGGYFYAGVSEQIANLLGYDCDDWMPAYVKGDKDLRINDDLYLEERTAWYNKDGDCVEITPSLHNGGIVRLPKDIFDKYFIEMFTT